MSFAKRYGYSKAAPPITIREDAPTELRNVIVDIAYESGLSPHDVRSAVCRHLRKQEDPNNWSAFPNVDFEARNHIESCEWYEVYEIIEKLFSLSNTETFEDELNAYFRKRGIGWKLEAGEVRSRDQELLYVNRGNIDNRPQPDDRLQLDPALVMDLENDSKALDINSCWYKVQSSGLNLRSLPGAGSDSNRIMILGQEQIVRKVAEIKDLPEWWRVEALVAANVIEGFVAHRYLTPLTPKEVEHKAWSRPVRPLQVFLCHSSGDKPRVTELCQQLREEGLAPWLDQERILPGQNWRLEVEHAVRDADVIMICLSQNAVDKAGFVQREIKIAFDMAEEKPEGSIYVIPARLEDCKVPERLKQYQWVDLFEESGFERLLAALRLRALENSGEKGSN